jgi:hypothetical protein
VTLLTFTGPIRKKTVSKNGKRRNYYLNISASEGSSIYSTYTVYCIRYLEYLMAMHSSLNVTDYTVESLIPTKSKFFVFYKTLFVLNHV